MKHEVYDELIKLISEDKLIDKIGEARASGKKYAMICNLSFGDTHQLLRNRKKLVLGLQPNGMSIYNNLLYKLLKFPINYQINMEEPWCIKGYKFRLYISWVNYHLSRK